MRMQLRMPGRSHRGPLPAMMPEQEAIEREIRRDVEHLAGNIGERNVHRPAELKAAETFLSRELEQMGYTVRRESYEVLSVPCTNIEVEIAGSETPGDIVIVGAHYDSVVGSPAANDNASGVAATLALARRFAGRQTACTLRFVMFVNEEPPWFWTEEMGSLVYAKACRSRGENVVAMLTPETIGCYSDEAGSQRYPMPMSLFYPDTGDFIGFVGMYEARALVTRCVKIFRERCQFPCEGAALPSIIPMVGASDHWSFWRQGYPALMITDTAPFRYAHYHMPSDTPDKLDYARMARVVSGLLAVVEDLAGG
jgi:Zn-dependent M28 family amino/carboxypeptidase